MPTVEDARPIPGESGYRATRDGVIYSNRRPSTWHPMTPGVGRDGYEVVYFSRDNHTTARRVHVLVLLTFGGPKPSDQHVARHLNGNRLDNRAPNLAWGTVSENAEDARRHGTAPWFEIYGARNGAAKLSEADVLDIEKRARARQPALDLAAEFGVSRRTIYQIRDHTTWRHLWPDTRAAFLSKRTA
jgi:hypothetical protein